jgi:CheY-like chemotaxis protein
MVLPDEILHGLQVLVVDPNEDNCELLRLVLESYHMQVYQALTMAQALTLVRQVQPEIVITELNLPGSDSSVLLDAIQALERGRGSKVITVAVTADMRQSETQALAAGFAKLLLKPLDVMELGPLLAELITQEEPDLYREDFGEAI